MERLRVFERERRHLLSLAFRILGSEPDAEDAVQEAWIKFSRSETSSIRNVPAWLTRVVTRTCLDSLRRRREVPREETHLPAGSHDDAEETALLADELTDAFVVVLNELTPPQRVALVLHDAFGVSFSEVAHILHTTAESAKKLASRARTRVRERSKKSPKDADKARPLVQAFLRAVQDGDTKALVALLDPNVVRLADAHVLPHGEGQRRDGVQAIVEETHAFRHTAARARVALIDGSPGIVLLADSAVQMAIVIRTAQERIVQFDVIADPQRLALLEVKP